MKYPGIMLSVIGSLTFWKIVPDFWAFNVLGVCFIYSFFGFSLIVQWYHFFLPAYLSEVPRPIMTVLLLKIVRGPENYYRKILG